MVGEIGRVITVEPVPTERDWASLNAVALVAKDVRTLERAIVPETESDALMEPVSATDTLNVSLAPMA